MKQHDKEFIELSDRLHHKMMDMLDQFIADNDSKYDGHDFILAGLVCFLKSIFTVLSAGDDNNRRLQELEAFADKTLDEMKRLLDLIRQDRRNDAVKH